MKSSFPAKGKIASIKDGLVVFHPTGTNYELHLKTSDGQTIAESDRPVEITIRVRARKVWTVPSGGNFIAPIFGPPKTIQGRVKWLDDQTLVVQAGTNFVVEMPGSSEALDLANGPIGVGTMVNVTAMPGAAMELVTGGA